MQRRELLLFRAGMDRGRPGGRWRAGDPCIHLVDTGLEGGERRVGRHLLRERIGLPNAGRRVPAADDELYVGCPAAESAADVAGIHLRLRVKVGQADDVHAVEVELPQRSLADSDRRQDTRTDAAFAEHLRHHLGGCTIEFRAPRQAED